MKREKLMKKYKILVDKEQSKALTAAAKEKNMTVESFISQIINKYFISPHTMNQEDMAKGYQEMADLNLELAQ